MFLNNNRFSGETPLGLYTLTDLVALDLSNNTDLSGSLPSSIGGRPLTFLRTSNTSMGGPLPDELFTLTDLRTLDLGFGAFTGPLSESFSQLTNLESAVLHNNMFSGTIPNGFALIPFLGKFAL